MIPEIQAISGGGLSVLKGVFPPLENRGFTRGLRGRRGRTKVKQDKAGSLGPAPPHRPATPVGDYGCVKGIPGKARIAVRAGNRSLTGFWGRFSGKFGQEIPAWARFTATGKCRDHDSEMEVMYGKTERTDALERGSDAR